MKWGNGDLATCDCKRRKMRRYSAKIHLIHSRLISPSAIMSYHCVKALLSPRFAGFLLRVRPKRLNPVIPQEVARMIGISNILPIRNEHGIGFSLEYSPCIWWWLFMLGWVPHGEASITASNRLSKLWHCKPSRQILYSKALPGTPIKSSAVIPAISECIRQNRSMDGGWKPVSKLRLRWQACHREMPFFKASL